MRNGKSAGGPERAWTAACAVLLALGCSSARPPAPPERPPPDPRRHAFEIPGGGALELSLPPRWAATVVEPEEHPAPMTIRLEPEEGGSLALLTPFLHPRGGVDEAAVVDTARLFADLARRNALAGSVEREIPLADLVGEGVRGFWFGATDRALVGKEPGEGEFRHVLQGAAAVGPLVVAFVLLDNGPGPQRAQLLELVRGARHAPGDEGADPGGGGPLELDEEARTVPLRVEAPGRSFSVLVDLPGFRMFAPRRGEGGAVLVLGRDHESGLVASVILRPDARAGDAAACRAADLERIRAAVPAPLEVRLSTAGDAARAAYLAPDARGEEVRWLHGHAWLFREGLCANVHVSAADPTAEDERRMERILASARFGEEL